MKTNKLTPILLFLTLATVFTLAACGKSSNNSTTANQACSTTPSGYGVQGYNNGGYNNGGYNNGGYNNNGYNGGQLYITGTQTPASAGQCVSVNGVPTNGGAPIGNGINGGPCNGTYYSPQLQRYGICQLVSAYQSTCAGMPLINQFGQQIVCQ